MMQVPVGTWDKDISLWERAGMPCPPPAPYLSVRKSIWGGFGPKIAESVDENERNCFLQICYSAIADKKGAMT